MRSLVVLSELKKEQRDFNNRYLSVHIVVMRSIVIIFGVKNRVWRLDYVIHLVFI